MTLHRFPAVPKQGPEILAIFCVTQIHSHYGKGPALMNTTRPITPTDGDTNMMDGDTDGDTNINTMDGDTSTTMMEGDKEDPESKLVDMVSH